MTGQTEERDIKNKNGYKRLLLLCKMVIDQAMMGEDYLILFLKRDRWEEFKSVVKELTVDG